MMGGKYVSGKKGHSEPEKSILGPNKAAQAQWPRIKKFIDTASDRVGNLIALKRPSDYFGELALMGDAKRSASVVVCSEKAAFLTIRRAPFQRAVESGYKQEKLAKEKFLKEQILKGLPNLARSDVVRMGFLMNMEHFPKGHVFCDEGLEKGLDFVYFIQQGECAIMQRKQSAVVDYERAGADENNGFKPLSRSRNIN